MPPSKRSDADYRRFDDSASLFGQIGTEDAIRLAASAGDIVLVVDDKG